MDNCFGCKWFNQGEFSGRCFNPKQKDKSLIGYCYWNFSCYLIEKGERLSDEEMIKLGYEKIKKESNSITSEDLSYFYFKKK
jgi:hypothetical protein